jgi:hypothetical protein
MAYDRSARVMCDHLRHERRRTPRQRARFRLHAANALRISHCGRATATRVRHGVAVDTAERPRVSAPGLTRQECSDGRD